MDTICPAIFISSATGITVGLLIYFPFPDYLLFWMDTICPVIFYFHRYWNHSVSTYLFSLSLTSSCSGWTLYPVIFYFLSYSDHSESTYIFFLSFTSCCSGWTLYIQSFSISSATQITVCLLIYFPFPWLHAVLDGHSISSHFLFPLLLGSQRVYFFISTFLSFLLFCWTLYIQSFYIFFATWITLCLLIYFSFPFLPAVLDGHYMSSHFLFLLLLG